MTQFSTLGLAAEILRAIEDQGYTEATPIQAQAIPAVLEGRDLLAAAQTGTGKTAGFTLPLLHKLSMNATSGPMNRPLRALILTPTRELAAQVNDSVRTYGKHLRLKSTMVCGGLSMRPQVEALKRGVDILVATPGRLMDHMQQRTVDLSKIDFLVLDEADRMLDMGFIHDIKRIMAALPKQRQSLLFSATFSEEIRTLANGLLRNPAVIEVARRNADSELVSQRVYSVDQARKRELLTKLVAEGNWQQVLVFMRTKHGANRLAEQLEKSGIEADAIHGNKSQGARTRALNDFKRGAVRVLVATDIAARGIDIQELPHVINYELPNVPEDYVHRIGRTGRAGSSGEAISLVARDEEPLLRDIERVLKRKMPREVVPGFERGSAPGTPIMVTPSAEARPARSVASAREFTPGDHPARKRAPRPRARTGEQPAHRRAEGSTRNEKAPRRPQFAEMRFNNEKREVDGNRPAAARTKNLDDNGDVNGNRADLPIRPQFAETRNNVRRGANANRPAAPRANSGRPNGGPAGAGRTNGDRAKRFDSNGEVNGNRADTPRRENKSGGEVRASAGYPSGLQKGWAARPRRST